MKMKQTENTQQSTSEAPTRSVGVQQLVMRCRDFEIDHEPDGWPAIQMREVSALCDALDAPKWENGEPANIRAAAADAAEWLKTIKPKRPENRRRVDACLVDLLKWIHGA
jgi:hypothetical protein